MPSKKVQVLASLGMLCSAIIWGFAFVVVKNTLDLIPPIYMLAFRFTIAALALGAVLHKKLRSLTRAQLKQGFVLGLFLFFAYAFQTVGCQYTTAGKNAFLTTVYVIIVPFLHWFISKQKPDRYNMVATWLALFGIGLLSLNNDLSVNIGDILTLVCGVFYALQIVYIDKYTESTDPVMLTFLQLAMVALISWVAAPIYDGPLPMEALNSSAIKGTLYLAFGSSLAGFLLQTVGQKYTPAAPAAILLSMESVFGALFSAIFLRERMTAKMLLGCVLIFVAIILAETKLSFLKKKDKKIRS